MKVDNKLLIILENEKLFDKDYNFVKNKLATILGIKSKEVEKQLKVLQSKKIIDFENGKIVKANPSLSEIAKIDPKKITTKEKVKADNEMFLGTLVKIPNGEIGVKLRDARLPICHVEQTEEVVGSVGKTCVVKVSNKKGEYFAKVENIFGLADDPISENTAIAKKYGFSNKFPEKVLQEARNIPQYVTEKDREGRTNLEHIPFIAIDPPHPGEIDDAIYDEPVKDGFRTYVAIADISSAVKPGSELDKEAFKRGNSAYLGGGVYPMLPFELSKGAFSFAEGQPRLALVASAIITHDKKIKDPKIELAVINVKKSYAYDEAEKTHLNQEGFDVVNKKTKKHLDFMYNNTKALEEIFGKMLEFDSHEPQYKFSADGTSVEDIKLSNKEYSHKVVEVRMLLMNIIIAQYFKEHGLCGIFRVHDKPREEKFNALVKKLQKFGINYNLQYSTESFKGLIEVIKKSKARDYLMSETVRTMCIAGYRATENEIAHFALGIANKDWGYMHTTAPLRRYVDLLIHRMLKDALLNKKPRYSKKMLELIADHLNAQQKKADDAEMESDEYLACLWAKQHQGETMEGYICQIDESFVKVMTSDGTVPVLLFASKLADESGEGFKLSADKMSLEGTKNKYELGEKIEFKISDVDFNTRTVFGSQKFVKNNTNENLVLEVNK